jgi:hypothetical protein
MSIIDIDQVSRVYSVPPAGHASLTVFAEGEVRHSPQRSKPETSILTGNSQLVSVPRDEFNLILLGLSKLQKTLR